MSKLKGYDSRCQELAEYFLQDYPNVSLEKVADLSQDIQDAIESWFSANLDESASQ